MWPIRTAKRSEDGAIVRVAIDKTDIKISSGWSWLYAAIDVKSRLILDVALFGRRDILIQRQRLHRLTEKYDETLRPFQASDWRVTGFSDVHLLRLYGTLYGRLYNEHNWSKEEIETFVNDRIGQAEIFEAPVSKN